MRIKASRFNIPVPLRHGRSVLYNSFSRSLTLLEREDRQRFDDLVTEGEADLDDTFNMDLLGTGLLIPDDVDELSFVEQHYRQSRYESDVATLTICPTLACNFGCDYCFQGTDKASDTLSAEDQDGILRLFERIVESHPNLRMLHVAWYGGEPLTRVEVIKGLSDRLIAACQERGLAYTASMVSHGYFLNREVAQALYDRGLATVQVTLDGPQEVHDARRHLLSKKGTFDRIVENLKSWVREIPIQVQIRVNIDERNRNDLFRLVDSLDEHGLGGLPNFKVYFAPVESMTPGCHAVSEMTMRKLDYGLLETRLFQHALRRGLADMPTPATFLGICSAVRPFDFIVVPGGDVHKCWETVSYERDAVGNLARLEALFTNRPALLQSWDDFDPFTHDTCRNCKILPNCAGSCAHKFVDLDAAVGESILPCPSLKYSVREKIILKCLEEGYITEDCYDPEEIRTDPKEICSEVFNPEAYRKPAGRLPVVNPTFREQAGL